jgi:hypothetical protein
MTRRPSIPPRQAGPATLGRLGGLTAKEADRGERALWLAGDGHRAALFHLGALTRLNELGLLAQIGTVGAVSGGSILAALLATRVPWPLHGAYRDWPEQVAEPLREIASRNARARAVLRRPLPPSSASAAALEEQYARELVDSMGGEPRWGPRFVFGASGLTLSGLAAGWEECLEWDLGASSGAGGYEPELVRETIAAVRTDLDAFGEAERAVLENHGYLLADAALRRRGMSNSGGVEAGPAEPPHPRWMAPGRVRDGLASSDRQTLVGRLRPRRAGRVERVPERAAPELTELLERHRPVLQYDSLESCRADSAATICEVSGAGRSNSLHRADGSLIAAAAPAADEPKLSLEFLGGPRYASGEPALSGDYLVERGGAHAEDALAIRSRDATYADVVYGRARHDRDGSLWLQYWFFYYVEDRGLLGLERRQGDWEMVQLRIGEDGLPEAATFARHGGGVRLLWDEVELAATGDGQAPVVYPARGSHASLPRPGSYPAPVFPDHNDGLGPRLRPRLETIADDGPSWILWPGRWGSTRRREHFEADSPRGPRRQPQWWEPSSFHEECAPWSGEALDPATAPPAPQLEARVEGSLALVSYGFPAGGEAAARIVAAPFDDGETAGSSHPFAVEAPAGELALQLSRGREWSGVRVAATSARGVPGKTVSARFR